MPPKSIKRLPPKSVKRKREEKVEVGEKSATKQPKKAADANGTAAVEKPTKWLFKSEPESRMEKGVDMKFGFSDLKAEKDGVACWDGVRNYQARNFMRNMKVQTTSFLPIK